MFYLQGHYLSVISLGHGGGASTYVSIFYHLTVCKLQHIVEHRAPGRNSPLKMTGCSSCLSSVKIGGLVPLKARLYWRLCGSFCGDFYGDLRCDSKSRVFTSGDFMAISLRFMGDFFWQVFDFFAGVIAELMRYVNMKHDSTMSPIVLQ